MLHVNIRIYICDTSLLRPKQYQGTQSIILHSFYSTFFSMRSLEIINETECMREYVGCCFFINVAGNYVGRVMETTRQKLSFTATTACLPNRNIQQSLHWLSKYDFFSRLLNQSYFLFAFGI